MFLYCLDSHRKVLVLAGWLIDWMSGWTTYDEKQIDTSNWIRRSRSRRGRRRNSSETEKNVCINMHTVCMRLHDSENKLNTIEFKWKTLKTNIYRARVFAFSLKNKKTKRNKKDKQEHRWHPHIYLHTQTLTKRSVEKRKQHTYAQNTQNEWRSETNSKQMKQQLRNIYTFYMDKCLLFV